MKGTKGKSVMFAELAEQSGAKGEGNGKGNVRADLLQRMCEFARDRFRHAAAG